MQAQPQPPPKGRALTPVLRWAIGQDRSCAGLGKTRHGVNTQIRRQDGGTGREARPCVKWPATDQRSVSVSVGLAGSDSKISDPPVRAG